MSGNFYFSAEQRGNFILLREWDANKGQEVRRKVPFKPVMFVPSKNPEQAKFHGIMGEAVDPVKFKSIRDAKDFINRYDGVDNFKIYGNDDFAAQFIAREYPGTIKFDQSKIRIFNLDIEVHSAVQMYGPDQNLKIRRGEVEKMISRPELRENMETLLEAGVEIYTVTNEWEPLKYFRFTQDDAFPKPEVAKWPVTLVGLRDSYDGKYHIWGFGNEEWDPIERCKAYSKELHKQHILEEPQHDLSADDVVYHDCVDEADLLRQFVEYWTVNTPHIYTGWNTEGFDTPYLCNRIEYVLGESVMKQLSPWGVVTKRQKEDDYGNMKDVFNILGVAQLDYLDLYKKYTYKMQEAYKLDHIAHVELGDGKLSYEEAGSLRKLYRMDYQKYVEYNAIDILCVERIERKKKFIDVVATIAYYAKINYESTFSPVYTWDIIITNYLMARNQVVPAMKISEKPRKYAGAFVKDPQLGQAGWTCSIDLDSLYPHLIMQWNIGPETMIPRHKLPAAVRAAIEGYKGYDFDEFGDPVVDGPNGRDAYIMRFARMENDTSSLKKYPIGMAANLACFDNRRTSFLSELMEFNYAGRKFDKKQMLAMEQEEVWWKNYAKDNTFTVTDEDMQRNRKIGGLPEEMLFINDSGLSEAQASAKARQCGNEAARLNCMQMAKKILLNSCYGAIGNRFFRFFNIQMAEAITLSGQLAIQFIADRMSNEINRIVGNTPDGNGEYEKNYITAIDTDSNYVNMDDVVKKFKPEEYELAKQGDVDAKDTIVNFLDNVFEKHLQKFMDDSYKELQLYMNAKQQKMNMSREMIAQSGFWTAKKRYVLKCWDSEGVRFKDPYWKIMGQDAIRSSTPEVVRGWLKGMYKVIVEGTESDFQEKIAEFKEKWMTLPPHEIAKNSSCNGINKWTDPDTIFHPDASWQARCGILYNHLVREKGLEREIDLILDGDKCKLVELKEPNPVKYSKVAFPVFLDERLGLDKYIDRTAAFEKNALAPMKKFVEILGWQYEQTGSLEDFFC